MSSKVKQVSDAVVKRDVNKWIFRLRQFLMLRDFTHNQRHEFEMAKRTQPQPLLPGGFAHKLSGNYYYDRDARRQVGQPQLVFSNTIDQRFLTSSAPQTQLTAGTISQQPVDTTPTSVKTSRFVSITEAERETTSLLAAISKKEQNIRNQPRTPGKMYNWDG